MSDDTTSSTVPLRPISPSVFPQPTLSQLPSTSDIIRSSGELSAPDAAAALSSVHPPDIDMEPERGGHRRRRSSLMNSLDTASKKGKARRSNRVSPGGANIPEDSKLEDEDETSEDVELDALSDDGLEIDEETGLTGKDKVERKGRRRRNTLMDQRVAADAVTAQEKKEADQNVLKSSLINGLLIGLWYLFSLSISIYNKWMFDPKHLNFHFPLFTTCFHMLVQFSLASLVLFFLPHLRPRYDSLSNPNNTTQVSDAEILQHKKDSEKPLMTRMFYLTRIGPCGMATGLDIGLGNMSLQFISLTFYTMCKSSALAFVLLFAFLFRLEIPSWRLVGIIATMTIGVVMMVAGEVDFSTLGFILVISAAFFSGFRWSLTQILLIRNPATSNPFSSIFYLAPVMFASLLLLATPLEGFGALAGGLRVLVDKKGPVLGPILLLFPGCIAFCMTASEFALLQRTSVVTLSIAGIFKEVVTISAAGLVFHDPLTPINISGLFVTIGAIAAYNYIKIRKMREDAQKEVHGAHTKLNQVESDVDGDADGETESEEEGWNTAEGSYITSDGDILPNPDGFKRGAGESSRLPGEPPNREEVMALAASKRELSD